MEIKRSDLLADLFPPAPDSSTVTVAVPRRDYAASRLCRAVEDADAHVLNLDVTSRSDAARVVARLRVAVSHPLGVARSLERYGCEVLAADGPAGQPVDPAMAERAAQVLRFIEM